MVNCPFCGSETKVLDKRTTEITRRRRECLKCEKRFTTYERPEINIMVVKKDSRREPYSREKIVAGMQKACEKRPVSREQVEDAASRIENEIRRYDEISTKKIGELVMKALLKMDKVAYVRFASVYRSFDDITSFEKEVKMLKIRR